MSRQWSLVRRPFATDAKLLNLWRKCNYGIAFNQRLMCIVKPVKYLRGTLFRVRCSVHTCWNLVNFWLGQVLKWHSQQTNTNFHIKYEPDINQFVIGLYKLRFIGIWSKPPCRARFAVAKTVIFIRTFLSHVIGNSTIIQRFRLDILRLNRFQLWRRIQVQNFVKLKIEHKTAPNFACRTNFYWLLFK